MVISIHANQKNIEYYYQSGQGIQNGAYFS